LWDPKKILLCYLSFSQIWFIPLVDDCQSTLMRKLKKINDMDKFEINLMNFENSKLILKQCT